MADPNNTAPSSRNHVELDREIQGTGHGGTFSIANHPSPTAPRTRYNSASSLMVGWMSTTRSAASPGPGHQFTSLSLATASSP